MTEPDPPEDSTAPADIEVSSDDIAALVATLAAVPEPPPGRLDDIVAVALRAYDDERRGDAKVTDGVRSRPTRRRWQIAAAAALVVLAGVAAMLFVSRDHSSVPESVAASRTGSADAVAAAAPAVPAPTSPTSPAAAAAAAAPTTTVPTSGGIGVASSASSSSSSASKALAAGSVPDLGAFPDVDALVRQVELVVGASDTSSGAPASTTTSAAGACAPTGAQVVGRALLGGRSVLVTVLDGSAAGGSGADELRGYDSGTCELVVDVPLNS